MMVFRQQHQLTKGSRSRDAPTVPISILHSILNDVDCDVLLLQDCPSIPEAQPFSGNGTLEAFSARGFKPAVSEAGKYSFTVSIVQELAHAAHTADWLSVVELHRRLINRM